MNGKKDLSGNFLSFVWIYSFRQQIVILALTAISFPLLYMTLELPKQIINDAIGGDRFPYTVMGFSFNQNEYLVFLCLAYLFFILAGGILKMQTNTYKGVVGERLLRRLRYQLVRRIVRFPLPYFTQVSQGSLISMVTAETESVGALMGEAFARPLFAAGQMLTILTFLFVQNVWLGLAAVAMVPFQAWIVPRLQRTINQLNKKRILDIRTLSALIGETVSGADDLRANGGVRYALAQFSKRFGDIFKVRLEIYQRKFFLKFLNNTLNQVAPFSLLLVGGYLTIIGQLTVGALAAALASYKELLGPWRELLTYYSQIQDTSLRYRTIVEQFDPPGMIDEALFFDEPEEIPHLNGPIVLKDATVTDQFGTPVLAGMNAEFPAGGMIAIRSQSASIRQALARALSRSIMPVSGHIFVGKHDLAALHQSVVSARIGVVPAAPRVFTGTIGQNDEMALMRRPDLAEATSKEIEEFIAEARRVGNSTDPVDVPWLDTSIAGVHSGTELRAWWSRIIRETGFEPILMRRSLNSQMRSSTHPQLTACTVGLREAVANRLKTEKLDGVVHRFDLEKFNPALTALENALFAIRKPGAQRPGGRIDPDVWALIDRMGLADYHKQCSYDLLDTLVQTFSSVDIRHPMFKRLAEITPESFGELKRIHRKKQRGEEISDSENALVCTLPLRITADQLGEAFPADLREFLVNARKNSAGDLQRLAEKYYEPIRSDTYNDALTLLENILFGRIKPGAQTEAEKIQAAVIEELEKAGISKNVLNLADDIETGFSGSKVEQSAFERIAFVRATLKRPDILILDKPFANASPETRKAFRKNIRGLLPDATIIQLEADLPEDEQFDKVFEICDGLLIDLDLAEAAGPVSAAGTADTAAGDLSRKLQVLSQVSLFSELERQQLRLIAFGATWMEVAAGDYIFRAGDRADGAYVLVNGTADLRWPREPMGEEPITEIRPGRLIGELAVLLNEPRALDLVATSDVVGLKISSQVFNDVIDHDAHVASSLLRTVSRYLLREGERLEQAKLELGRLKRRENA